MGSNKLNWAELILIKISRTGVFRETVDRNWKHGIFLRFSRWSGTIDHLERRASLYTR